MKFKPLSLALSTAIAFAIIWILCVIIVWALPVFSMGLFNDMMHSQDMNMTWHISVSGLITGLIAWSACGGFTAWLIAVFYNRFSS